MKYLILLYFLFSVSIFSEPATKQDIQMLIQQMDKRFEQLREEMNERFEQMQTQMDRRFEQMQTQMDRRFELLTHIMYWVMGVLSAFIVPLYFLIWKQYRKPNIYQLEQQIYQSEPEIKARIYLHLKKQAEDYKTSIPP